MAPIYLFRSAQDQEAQIRPTGSNLSRMKQPGATPGYLETALESIITDRSCPGLLLSTHLPLGTPNHPPPWNISLLPCPHVPPTHPTPCIGWAWTTQTYLSGARTDTRSPVQFLALVSPTPKSAQTCLMAYLEHYWAVPRASLDCVRNLLALQTQKAISLKIHAACFLQAPIIAFF